MSRMVRIKPGVAVRASSIAAVVELEPDQGLFYGPGCFVYLHGSNTFFISPKSYSELMELILLAESHE